MAANIPKLSGLTIYQVSDIAMLCGYPVVLAALFTMRRYGDQTQYRIF
jgi:hypothetical protein